MTIKKFIEEYICRRLDGVKSLIVYDPERRYVDIVLRMASDEISVVDGSKSTILGREEAMDIYRSLAENDKNRLIVYLPIKRPKTDSERQADPYQIFALGGGFFPEGDGESYHALCRQSSPEHVDKIDALFKAGAPNFETINNLTAGGSNWPKLKTLLKAESAVEILTAMLSPSNAQKEALENDETWSAEFKEFCNTVLGLTIKTKSKKLDPIISEVRRYVLFSEFVFDLPVEVPESLKCVPRAESTCKSIIYSVCDILRTSEKHQFNYMEAAGTVDRELHVRERIGDIIDLGERDTFAFEECVYLKVFTESVLEGDYAHADEVAGQRSKSIWVRHIGERKQLWTVAERSLQLLKTAEDLNSELNKLKLDLSSVIDFYCNRFRQLDAIHRGFEQAVTDAYGDLEDTAPLVEGARKAYLKSAESLQAVFIDAVRKEGWPASGLPHNTDVFTKFIAPWLEDRKKTAFIMVDALRYELAVDLENELAGEFSTEIAPVCAQLPTITSVGMAALMPKSAGNLRLVNEKGKLVPYINDTKVMVPKDRIKYTASIYGDRCRMCDLDDLVTKKKLNFPATLQLLLIKTTDIDQMGEMSALEARRMLPRIMQKLIAGIGKLRKLGFDRAVMATDHGFILLDERAIGDVVTKPSGDWIVVKDRCLLGKGGGGHGVLVFDKNEVGIPGDFEDYAVPKSLGTFARGNPYFHGGLSLQECILPVLTIDFAEKAGDELPPLPEISLSYKGGTTEKITTRRPMIEISLFKSDMFEEEIEFSLEAYSGKELVGQAVSCSQMNPSTGLICIKPGTALKIPLKMDEDFQGTFEVRAVDPMTLVNYDTIKLKTNYMD